ncbi:MAG: alpha/beta fold hydrolase, partial [Promethearchaeota archaeon]
LSGQYTMENCADDLYAIYHDFIMGKFGYKSINLFGHSMGGFISLIFVSKHPEQINKLFLISTWVKNYMSEKQLEMFKMLLQKYDENFMEVFSLKKEEQIKLVGNLEKLNKFFPHWNDPTLLPEKEATVEFGLDMLKNDNVEEALEKITWPTHIIVGTKDNPDLRKNAGFLRDHISSATYDIIESGHNIAIEARETVPPLIMKYLKK